MHANTPSFFRAWKNRSVTGRQPDWIKFVLTSLGLDAGVGSPTSGSLASAAHSLSAGVPNFAEDEVPEIGLRDLGHGQSHAGAPRVCLAMDCINDCDRQCSSSGVTKVVNESVEQYT